MMSSLGSRLLTECIGVFGRAGVHDALWSSVIVNSEEESSLDFTVSFHAHRVMAKTIEVKSRC